MYDWSTSFWPHKCHQCHNIIKRKTPHVVYYGFEGEGNKHYCDPHCAHLQWETERKMREAVAELNRIIKG